MSSSTCFLGKPGINPIPLVHEGKFEEGVGTMQFNYLTDVHQEILSLQTLTNKRVAYLELLCCSKWTFLDVRRNAMARM
jgi:hypothetical protein